MAPNSNHQLAHIVAVAQNGVIGRQGGLPWHLSGDLKHFKKITTGSVILMGRKTYDSIGRPLPNRFSIVLTSSPQQFSHLEKNYENLRFVSTLDAAFQIAGEQTLFSSNPIFVIGGGELYAKTMDQTHIIHLTQIHANSEGDTFYPNITANPAFELISNEPQKEGDLSFEFRVYRRL